MQPVLITSSGTIASSWEISADEIDSGIVAPGYQGDFYLADVNISPGHSGSPVYLLEREAVVGVCEGRVYGFTVTIPVSYVLDLLDKSHVKAAF
jgi:hypothetical protein